MNVPSTPHTVAFTQSNGQEPYYILCTCGEVFETGTFPALALMSEHLKDEHRKAEDRIHIRGNNNPKPSRLTGDEDLSKLVADVESPVDSSYSGWTRFKKWFSG